MIRIALVGPGLMGKQHVERVYASDEACLAAIIAPLSKHNQSYALTCDVPIYEDLQTCIDSSRPDGVIISSPNEYHVEQTLCCINNRVPVLVEKPLAVDLVEGSQLVEAAAEKSFLDKIMVGHHRTYSAVMQTAVDLINQGLLGQLVSFQGSAQFYKPAEYFQQGAWRTRLGGGPVLINMIHEVGNMRRLMGEIKAVQVMCSSFMRGYPVEDTVVINLQFQSGALGSFVLSDTGASAKSWEMTSGENPSYPYYPDEHCYSVTGTLGSLDIPSMMIKKYACEQEASWMVPFLEDKVPITTVDPLVRQLESFIAVIQGLIKPKVSVLDGYRNLLVVHSILKAGRSGITEVVQYS